MSKGWTRSFGEYVRSVAWGPDGGTLVAGFADGRGVVLDAVTGATRAERCLHAGGVQHVCWSAAFPGPVTAGEDGVVACWGGDLAVEVFRCALADTWVDTLALSPRDPVWAATAGSSLVMGDGGGGRLLELGDFPGCVSALAWRGDGERLAAATNGEVRLLRPTGTGRVQKLEWKAAYLSVAWSPDGVHLAAGTQENSLVYWSPPKPDTEPLQMTGYPSKIRRVVWDRGSRWVATDGGTVVTVWDVSGPGPAGRRPLQLQGHEARVAGLMYQPGGEMLASGDTNGAVWLWVPVKTVRGVPAVRVEGGVTQLVWRGDGRGFVVGTTSGELRYIE